MAAAVVVACAAASRPPFDPMNARDATTFPRAHGAHPGSALEWWYVTGILRDEKDYRMGFQVTFFRARIDDSPRAGSSWRPGDLYFAHYAISDLTSRYYRFDERVGRTSVALAGADSTDLRVWIRDWSLTRLEDGVFRLHASGDLGDLSLDLTPPRPAPVAWGKDYRSNKDPEGRSFSRYHTHPRMRVTGRYAAPGALPRPVRGTAWYDHEWSNGEYDPELEGWDWFGLRFRDGRSLMLYRMRDRYEETAHLFGGVVEKDGRVRSFGKDQVRMDPLRTWVSPRSQARYPVAWRIVIDRPGEEPLELDVSAALSDQELDTARSTRVAYWEGYVEGAAEEGDTKTKVEGYMELTGYAGGGVPGRTGTPR
ncbi:MAG TPA: lipocalin-like domain-containing protein [Candidatus Eisenbacteria bacterium]|nr:lipocalin-like domain-containing protein [Candidatus Eisenbacteria bacterium]